MKYLLMIPGPVELSEDVLEAYNGQTVAHYGPDWAEIYLRTERRLSGLFGCEGGRTFLMPGSGSLGLETVAETLCAGKKCLVLGNGMFGERLFSIVAPHAAKAAILRSPLPEPHDLRKLEKRLSKERFDAVLTVHVETSTGLRNPVSEIAEIANVRARWGLEHDQATKTSCITTIPA